MIKWTLLFVMTLAVGSVLADEPSQCPEPPTSILNFQPVGTWVGEGDGKWGHSTLERTYERILGGRFLLGKNTSTYAPQEKNPKGEVHTNWDIFSHDEDRNVYILRQFHDEGFVNTYELDSIEPGGSRLIFTTVQIENFEPGWRARETYQFRGPHEFTEMFELAGPDQDFAVFVVNRFTRKR